MSTSNTKDSRVITRCLNLQIPSSAYNTLLNGERTIQARDNTLRVLIYAPYDRNMRSLSRMVDYILLMHVGEKKDPKIVGVWLLYTAATVWTFCYTDYTGCLLAVGLAENQCQNTLHGHC